MVFPLFELTDGAKNPVLSRRQFIRRVFSIPHRTPDFRDVITLGKTRPGMVNGPMMLPNDRLLSAGKAKRLSAGL